MPQKLHQPEIHRADDGALEMLLGGGRPLCEPKSPQKAGGNALQVTLGGGRPLCEIWVGRGLRLYYGNSFRSGTWSWSWPHKGVIMSEEASGQISSEILRWRPRCGRRGRGCSSGRGWPCRRDRQSSGCAPGRLGREGLAVRRPQAFCRAA